MLIEATPNRSNSVVERIRDRKPPRRTFWGQVLGTKLVAGLPCKATNDRIRARDSGWRTRTRLSRQRIAS
jgi:hypothetical protein